MNSNEKGNVQLIHSTKQEDSLKANDGSNLQNYVIELLTQLLANGSNTANQKIITKASKENNLEVLSQVFETHDNIIVRVTMPKNTDEKKVKLYLGSNYVTIKGISEGDCTISIDSCFSKEEVDAVVKNNVLEIKLKKEAAQPPKEISIRYFK